MQQFIMHANTSFNLIFFFPVSFIVITQLALPLDQNKCPLYDY